VGIRSAWIDVQFSDSSKNVALWWSMDIPQDARPLIGSVFDGRHMIDLTGRWEAPAPGVVLWYRAYSPGLTPGERWRPTGRPRKAVFVRLVERGYRDDQWEVTPWRSYLRGWRGGLIIGSKSLYRIEGTSL
jgi:hypothetical protein